MAFHTLKTFSLSSLGQRASLTARLTRFGGYMVRRLDALLVGVRSEPVWHQGHLGSESNDVVSPAARALADPTHRPATDSHPDFDVRRVKRPHICYCLMGGTHLYPALFEELV